MAQRKAVYEVSSSSLYNLKAELFKKQAEQQQKKDGKSKVGGGYSVTPGRTKIIPPVSKTGPKIKQHGRTDASAADPNTIASAEESEDQKRWEAAKSRLEQKARLYDQMTSGQVFANPEEDDNVLIDFQRKRHENRDSGPARRRRYSESDSDSSNEEYRGPAVDENEWTEYEDYLGRSRRCLKRDLPSLLEENRRLAEEFSSDRPKSVGVDMHVSSGADEPSGSHFDFGPMPLEERSLLSEDMRREMARQEWERNPENTNFDLPATKPVTEHYQMYEAEDNRNLGVGYFRLSTDEAKRQEQLQELSGRTKQTEDQRKANEQLKQRREQAMKARLEKIRERKNLKVGVTTPPEDEDDWDFEKHLREKQQSAPKIEIAERSTPSVPREWDVGKDLPEDLGTAKYYKTQREERNLDFAPPSSYSSRPPPKKQRKSPSETRRLTDTDPVLEDYKPWEHIQPWSNKTESSRDGARSDPQRPYGFAPPPTDLYSDNKAFALQSMSKEEMRNHLDEFS